MFIYTHTQNYKRVQEYESVRLECMQWKFSAIIKGNSKFCGYERDKIIL